MNHEIDDQRQRHHHLAEKREQYQKFLAESRATIKEPVIVSFDLRGKYGRRLMEAMGKEKSAYQLYAEKEGMLSYTELVIEYNLAVELLPLTAPTAKKSLRETRRLAKIAGADIAVMIGQHGNSYGLISREQA